MSVAIAIAQRAGWNAFAHVRHLRVVVVVVVVVLRFQHAPSCLIVCRRAAPKPREQETAKRQRLAECMNCLRALHAACILRSVTNKQNIHTCTICLGWDQEGERGYRSAIRAQCKRGVAKLEAREQCVKHRERGIEDI